MYELQIQKNVEKLEEESGIENDSGTQNSAQADLDENSEDLDDPDMAANPINENNEQQLLHAAEYVRMVMAQCSL